MRKALFILGVLNDTDIEWLADNAKRRELDASEELVREGIHSQYVFILLDGRLSVRADMDREINSLLPGEFIGELSFLDSRPASATVVAATHSCVASIARDTLSAKLARDTDFASRFYRALGVFLAHRLRRQTVLKAPDATGALLDEDVEVEDELDPELLETVSIAAKRFEWIQDRFSGQ